MTTVVASPLADLGQIQGNILRAFREEHQAFLPISFRSRRAGARTWLAAVAGRVAGTDDVTPSRGAQRDGDVRRNGAAHRHGDAAPNGSRRALLNLGLTATGLVMLHPEIAGDLVGHAAFWQGPLGNRLDDEGRLTTAPALLGDVGAGDPERWVVGGLGTPVDALLTVAADDAESLRVAVDREVREAEQAGLEVLPVQWGEVLRDRQQGHRIEHFGFADGISQPGIRGFADSARLRPGTPIIAAGEFILGCAGERRPPTWTPRPTPAPWMRGGSFQVFRRLKQDVAGWWQRMDRLSEQGGTPEEAAARALGRHLDGRPLAELDQAGEINAFSFRGDDDGSRTPNFSHIRKVNPREDGVFRDRGHKMLRRGITFGPRLERGAADDGRERGMFFNAYMASIEDQFEFVQRRWAHDPGFPASMLARYGRGAQRVDGLDPVLGDDPESAGRRLGAAVVRGIPAAAFGGFVTTTGSVYAFAPSRAALRRLAGDDHLDGR
ncbi:Dyp-type peroxidase [Actinoplanes sp. GCM10030250]|uniref:Dyp-type peroxidase n=1 Tax=Actinoplanes sp. GCM10030250 TaxID=3273376 RepID=UPI00361D440A